MADLKFEIEPFSKNRCLRAESAVRDLAKENRLLKNKVEELIRRLDLVLDAAYAVPLVIDITPPSSSSPKPKECGCPGGPIEHLFDCSEDK